MRSVIAIVALLVSGLAFAATPEEILASCKEKYSSLAAIQSCLNDGRFDQIESGQVKIVERLDGIEGALEELKDREAPAGTAAPAASREAASAPSSIFVPSAGAPYRVLPRPSLVSTHAALEDKEPHTLKVYDLAYANSARNCGGVVGESRVLVTNHGAPVSIWAPPGAVSGFEEVYVDMDGDGQPDPRPYKVLNPEVQDDFWVTWRSGDDLRVVYLRDAGHVLTIPGLPLQKLWRPAERNGNVRACRPATASTPGGHRSIGAFALWPVR